MNEPRQSRAARADDLTAHADDALGGRAAASDPSVDPGGTINASSPAVREFFGDRMSAVEHYAELLAEEGVLRGLIGPRELPRLWERHILNCAAVAQVLPDAGTVVDLGSGAGLPGIVLAAMRPDLDVVLLEPMERRTAWLEEVRSSVGLDHVRVRRGRAEDMVGQLSADAVTARAVASMDRLVPWAMPLLKQGGVLLAMKGDRGRAELEEAGAVIDSWGGGAGEVVALGTVPGVETTTVVRVVRERAVVPSRPQRPGRRRRRD
ncbi:16S rRNA (guanine(527)-N(7))-methyltransferase RsmG [Actinotalea sp. AC32]|nr:16S rRNA (guanine(527)-N(7))-methyltransferase RsmG [Actinotalea sp. AC32]